MVKSSYLPAHNESSDVIKDLHTFTALCTGPISKEIGPPPLHGVATTVTATAAKPKSRGSNLAHATNNKSSQVVKPYFIKPIAGSESTSSPSLVEACPDVDVVCVVSGGVPKFFKASSGLQVIYNIH